jgi:DNA-binding PadR family transcriptional regulator
LPAGLKDALLTYGSKAMDALKRTPNQAMHLFDIAKELTTRVDTLYPVMGFLVENGYLTRIPDPVGNDVFQLTESGKKVASDTTTNL